jgi:glycosyltransferase involved in cell wall biosynthesis
MAGGGSVVSLYAPSSFARTKRALSTPRPIFLYFGRPAIEKNLDAFLSLDLPVSNVVVGDGPLGHKLRREQPQVVFLGFRCREALAAIYATANVFVFPNRHVRHRTALRAAGSSDPVQRTPELRPSLAARR